MGCLGDDPPDPAKGYAAGIRADLETLPMRRLIEAMALLGERGFVDIPGRGGGKQEFDFTGLGEADYQRQYADQLTQQLLQIQRDFGPQFVEQRLKELETADPAGAAMRRQLWASIQESSGSLTPRPEQEQLRELIMGELARGGELDPETEERISQQVLGGQVGRGNYLGNAAAAQEAGALTGAQDAQRAQRQQQALAFLTGGLDPDDAAYREQQQDLANLGAFLTGETPTAQFSQLSGAQSGVVPFTTTGPLPGGNPQAGWQGVDNGYGQWNARQANPQVNPWVAGLGGAVQGFGLAMAGNWGGRPAQGATGEFEW